MDIARIVAGPEVSAAVAWWGSVLGRAATLPLAPQPTEAQRLRFQAALREAIHDHWLSLHAKGGFPWDPAHPKRGSALRTLSVDYTPDPLLTLAAEVAGYPVVAGTFPLKTTMRIDPRWVVVRVGDGEAKVIYPSL